MKTWFRNAHRRAVIDMHVTADDDRFLTQFDAGLYVDRLTQCQATSVVLYAHSHVGFCYFPTEVGTMHPGLGGRNIVAEVAELCREREIAVVAYFSLIFDTLAWRKDPDWRNVDCHGRQQGADSRSGVCCPNAPDRDYISALVREACEKVEFDGVRFDMTFWPGVCYCRHCARRFAAEVGGELPRIVDWHDATWVSFQRKREEWLNEFAALLTSAVRAVQPETTVEHQSSVYQAPWTFGVTEDLAEHGDLLQGDFYGDALQGSFVRKLFLNLSRNLPYGFETCVSVDLANYTALKSEDLLAAKAAAAFADGGAFVFIDSIDPEGSINKAPYERMGRVFGAMKPLEPYLVAQASSLHTRVMASPPQLASIPWGRGVQSQSRCRHLTAR